MSAAAGVVEAITVGYFVCIDIEVSTTENIADIDIGYELYLGEE